MSSRTMFHSMKSFFVKSPGYEQVPLEADDDVSQSVSESKELVSVARWKLRFWILFGISFAVIASLSLLCIYYAIAPSVTHLCYVRDGVQESYSPAREIVSYEQRWFIGDPDTPKFVGKPRPEMDEAWHNLLEGTLIRVSKEELDRANATSIPLTDGGYAAGLGVSHDLHCLKRIGQYFHKDYYYNADPQDWFELASHVEHCLESLRQSVLCQADTSLYTLEWTTHSRVKPTVRSNQPHVCANFDALHAWMIGRAAQMDRLVKPPEEFFNGHVYNEISGTIVDSADRSGQVDTGDLTA